MSKSIKLAVAQISTDPGSIPKNTNKIIEFIKKARKFGAKIIIFPELTIPGYMSLDLMLYPKYINENIKALKTIESYTRDVMVIVGFIDQDKKRIGPDDTPIRYNSAAIIQDGKLAVVQDKTSLPNYDVFFENRYFTQGRGSKLINFQELKLGVEICEDLWDEHYPIKVSQELIKKGIQILINISGSPFYFGKIFDRQRLIKRVSDTYKIPFIYVNTVGSQDGYDGELVFDGQSMVFDNHGKLIYLGEKFKEELFFVELDDLFKKNNKNLSLRSKTLPSYDQTEELYQAIVLAIREYFIRTNFKRAFIGLSGGIDSAVTTAIAAEALGKENITTISMPSSFTSKDSTADAIQLAKKLGVKIKMIPINEIFVSFINILKKEFNNLPFDVTEENIQARIRGMVLMAHANKFGGLVISTANKTETALGYTTLYGDMCGAIAPLADVSKLKVYDLAKFINGKNTKHVIPKNIITKVPSAELREDQIDEESLGAPYTIISPLVAEIIEDGKTTKQLIAKYPKNVVKYIISLINKNEYKRRQAAPTIKVTKKAFGLGRRIPIVHQFNN